MDDYLTNSILPPAYRCNKAYISASGLRTHWKTTSCRPSPAEEAMTAEKSSFVSEVEAAAAALLQHKHANDHGKSFALAGPTVFLAEMVLLFFIYNSMTF